MNYKIVAIDLAKNVFQVCALDKNHKVKMNKKVTRAKLLDTLRQMEPTLVVMESCYSANPWGREIIKLGHTVRLIPAYMVKPFVVGNKNDRNDALAIAEAALRPKVRFVPVKTIEQQDIQSLQRMRDLLLRQRTATSNQLRGLLAEYWIVIPKGRSSLNTKVYEILEDAEQPLTVTMRRSVHAINERLLEFDRQIKDIEKELYALLDVQEDFHLLQTIPGIGPVGAATFIAAINDAKHFKNGRELSAWIGLTPKQHSSGEKSILGNISKRGNRDLRRVLAHGARSVMNWCEKKTDPLSLWVKELASRMHPCKVIVALANKLARIAWAVLSRKEPFKVEALAN